MKIITIANQKGGVGKSTTASALGAGLMKCDKTVLFIDLDPQMNLTANLGADINSLSVYDIITGNANINDAIQNVNGKQIISGDRMLSGADAEFNLPGREYKLKKALKLLKNEYEYIVVDTPPALGILTVNALTASDYVIIPAEADVSSIQGVLQLNDTIKAVKEYCNPNLKIRGIVLTRYSKTILGRDLIDTFLQIANSIGTRVYETPIRECIAVKESKTQQQDIFTYAPKCNASFDYMQLTKSFLEGEDNDGKKEF